MCCCCLFPIHFVRQLNILDSLQWPYTTRGFKQSEVVFPPFKCQSDSKSILFCYSLCQPFIFLRPDCNISNISSTLGGSIIVWMVLTQLWVVLVFTFFIYIQICSRLTLMPSFYKVCWRASDILFR